MFRMPLALYISLNPIFRAHSCVLTANLNIFFSCVKVLEPQVLLSISDARILKINVGYKFVVSYTVNSSEIYNFVLFLKTVF